MAHFWIGYDGFDGGDYEEVIVGRDAAIARFNAINAPYKRLTDMNDNTILEYTNIEYWAQYDII